jgi:predicted nuclease of restriction endonuclease-like (RecB) superfamily
MRSVTRNVTAAHGPVRDRLPQPRDCLHGAETIDLATPELVMRDPYMLPFLGLADTYSESDLEAAILREIERFPLELAWASLSSSARSA